MEIKTVLRLKVKHILKTIYHMKKIMHIALIMLTGIVSSIAQNTGIIKGYVTDAQDKPVMFAPVAIMEGDNIIRSLQTDEDGSFTAKELTPGFYNIKTQSLGFNPKQINNVEVDPSQVAYVNMKLVSDSIKLPDIIVEDTWEKSHINPTFHTVASIKIEQIEQTPATRGDIIHLASVFSPAVLPTNDGKDLLIRGSRRGTTSYVVDGFRTMDVPNVPGLGIASMEVLTGGIPAEYGDTTGGVVIITTKDYFWESARRRIKEKQKEENEQ